MATVPSNPTSVFAEWVPALLYRLSVEQYEATVASGAFTPVERLHLLNGYLVAKGTQNDPHCTADDLCGAALVRVFPSGWYVRASKPVRLPARASMPEPDRCVMRGAIRDYTRRSPGPADIGLIVEVSDSSLSQDRKLAEVYGGSGIPIDWIINLFDRQVEVYTLPYDDGYHSRQDITPGDEVPVVIDGVEVGRIPVNDLLP
jgi:Uma2 family endonuclease